MQLNHFHLLNPGPAFGHPQPFCFAFPMELYSSLKFYAHETNLLCPEADVPFYPGLMCRDV